MANTTAVHAMKADSAYVQDAMFQSALVSVGTPSNPELNSDDHAAVVDTPSVGITNVMAIGGCDVTPSSSKEPGNKNGSVSPNMNRMDRLTEVAVCSKSDCLAFEDLSIDLDGASMFPLLDTTVSVTKLTSSELDMSQSVPCINDCPTWSPNDLQNDLSIIEEFENDKNDLSLEKLDSSNIDGSIIELGSSSTDEPNIDLDSSCNDLSIIEDVPPFENEVSKTLKSPDMKIALSAAEKLNIIRSSSVIVSADECDLRRREITSPSLSDEPLSLKSTMEESNMRPSNETLSHKSAKEDPIIREINSQNTSDEPLPPKITKEDSEIGEINLESASDEPSPSQSSKENSRIREVGSRSSPDEPLCHKFAKEDPIVREINSKSSSDESLSLKSSNEECGSIESLLNTKISKDYVNCVWSLEPLQSGSQISTNEMKVSDSNNSSKISSNSPVDPTDSPVESTLPEIKKTPRNQTTSKSNSGNKTVKPTALNKATPKPKFKILTANQTQSARKVKGKTPSPRGKSLLKTANLTKQDVFLTKKDNATQKASFEKSKVLSVTRKLQPYRPNGSSSDNVKKVGTKSSKMSHSGGPSNTSTDPCNTEIIMGKFQLMNLDPWFQNLFIEENLIQKLHVSYKKIMVMRSTPLYNPPASSRFAKGKMFECKACRDKFLLQTSLLIHISRESATIKYQCPVCKNMSTFNNRCSLINHLHGHGLSADSINPPDLFVSPPRGGQLLSSQDVHSLFEKCGECGNPVSSLRNHMQGHDLFDPIEVPGNPVKNDLLQCVRCRLLFPSNCSLVSHWRYHEQTPPFTCPECGKVFKTCTNLFFHVRTCCFFHSKENVIQCLCERKFRSPNNLKQHILLSHISRLFKCRECCIALPTIDQINVHLSCDHSGNVSHIEANGEQNYTQYFLCELCPGKMISRLLSEKHADSHCQVEALEQDVIVCGRCEELLDDSEKIPDHRLLCFTSKIEDDSDALSTRNSCSSPSKIPKSIVISEVSEDRSSSQDQCASISVGGDTFSTKLDIPSPQGITVHSKKCKSSIQSRVPQAVEPSTSPPSAKEMIGIMKNNEGCDSETFTENQGAGEYVNCRICKKAIAAPGDRVSVKRHFINHHQAIFLQALHNGRKNQSGEDNKVVCKFPIQTVLVKEEKKKKETLEKTGKKRKMPPCSTSKKSRKNLKKLDSSPFTMGAIICQNSAGKNKICYKCSFSSEDKVSFANHIITHKTNASDLQCPICGMCFIVRPPLEKHLLVQHNIKDVSEFLKKHGFEDGTEEREEEINVVDEPKQEELQENQCKVCKAQFDNALLLEKHFRVHGGAFLLASLKAKKV